MQNINYPDAAINTEQTFKLQQDFLRFQLDVKDELKFMLMDLLGFEFNTELDEWERNDGKDQQINVRGANAIMTFLRPRVTRIFSLSKTSGEDIDTRCLRYINDLTFMLCRHKHEYEIKSYQVMDNIIDLCDDIFFSTANKSLDGWEGDSIRKGHTHVETRETVINDQKERTVPFRIPFK